MSKLLLIDLIAISKLYINNASQAIDIGISGMYGRIAMSWWDLYKSYSTGQSVCLGSKFTAECLYIWLTHTKCLKMLCAIVRMLSQNKVRIMNHDMVHDRDWPETYENPLIECTITGLMGHIKKRT